MMNEKTVHFRYVRVRSENATHRFGYDEGEYEISFQSKEFRAGEGIILRRTEGGDPYEPLPTSLLTWMTVFLGEDALQPKQIQDPVHASTRGTLAFEPEAFDQFLRQCKRFPRRSYPRWRQRLLERAIGYYTHATRLGVYSMPISLGLFGLSLECIGNYDYGRRDRYFKLGDKRFVPRFREALMNGKRNVETRERVRRFEKRVLDDIELIRRFRNAFYGHSLLHQENNRREIVTALRRWYEREGAEPRFAQRTFRTATIERALSGEFWPLYKVGLRTTRIFLSLALVYRRIPFASRDFHILSELPAQRTS